MEYKPSVLTQAERQDREPDATAPYQFATVARGGKTQWVPGERDTLECQWRDQAPERLAVWIAAAQIALPIAHLENPRGLEVGRFGRQGGIGPNASHMAGEICFDIAV